MSKTLTDEEYDGIVLLVNNMHELLEAHKTALTVIELLLDVHKAVDVSHLN